MRYRVRSALALCRSIVEASVRRTFQGPRLPGWNCFLELGTQILKRHLVIAFKLNDASEARLYLDSVVFDSAAVALEISPFSHEKFRGSWFTKKGQNPRTTVLYFHGGGYSFYPKNYARFIALITLAAKSKTFALDYRLSPENRFPAQLEDALNAYRWLMEIGTRPEHLVLAGDSAGGNLALALLLAARDAKLPLPALAILLSPAADFERKQPSIVRNEPFDWIDKEMLKQWSDWFCDSAQRQDPFVSPVQADLRALPPLYIQAGRAEILYDSIQAFADRASAQGADVVLESWDHMNHDFQLFGPRVPQSAEALRRISEVIDRRVPGHGNSRPVCTADS
jgi:epsilon-lactone hydrolase